MPQKRKFSLSLGRKHKRTIKRRKLNSEKTEENDATPQWNWTPELEFTEQSHKNTDENTPCSSSTNNNDEWTPKESLNIYNVSNSSGQSYQPRTGNFSIKILQSNIATEISIWEHHLHPVFRICRMAITENNNSHEILNRIKGVLVDGQNVVWG